MPIALARKRVASPVRTPLPYGLLSVVQNPPEDDPHWQLGIDFKSEPCGPASSTVDPCPSAPADKLANATLDYRAGEAFTVYSWVDCDDFGTSAEKEAEARRALEWGEGSAVEAVFWTGSVSPTGAGITIEPHLAEDAAVVSDGVTIQTAATVVTGTAQKLKLALGMLEAALAECYQGQGVLHVPRELGPFLTDGGIVFRQGTQLVTMNGNLVALGTGYTGSSPAGVAGTTTAMWIYGTGAVMMRRSDIDVPDFNSSFNRLKNDLVMIAERTYSLAWECCHLAIPVNLETS